ncbi:MULTISPECIES: hypothetical protein [unclassified Nonomuraea]|uniref:hypothetical protein n=1 Tax=Nonomuraea sp. KC401 TaxID=1848324 RepID=UPI00191BDC5F|nr:MULTISPECIES: hypothetical protein [unclassified Nonomuraea]
MRALHRRPAAGAGIDRDGAGGGRRSRASFRYAARQRWDAIAKALKPVYTAPTEAAALERFHEFAELWGTPRVGQRPDPVGGQGPRPLAALNAFAITFQGRLTPTTRQSNEIEIHHRLDTPLLFLGLDHEGFAGGLLSFEVALQVVHQPGRFGRPR